MHTQAQINQAALAREAERDRRQAEWNALHYEILQRLVTEISRTSLDAQGLSMRVESLAAKVDAPRIERGPGHIWGAIAAAAILVMWVAAHAAARDSMPDPIRERDVAAIVDALGGGEDARRYAEAVVPRRETRLTIDPPAEASW